MSIQALISGMPSPVDSLWLRSLPASVAAGFPSPADDHMATRVDLMAQLTRHPEATFMLRVQGESMRDMGIFNGDVLVVDRAISPRSGHVVVAVLDGEFVCKTLTIKAGRTWLQAANRQYPDIEPRSGQTLEIWGVVVASVKQFPA
jgi:DNA polymerase V